MKAEIYSRTNCVFCDKAKMRLSKYNPTVHMLDQDYTRKDFFEKFPKPLITRDQLRLLKYDSILSKECKSNIDIGFVPKLRFDDEISKYSYMWKEGGEYSK